MEAEGENLSSKTHRSSTKSASSTRLAPTQPRPRAPAFPCYNSDHSAACPPAATAVEGSVLPRKRARSAPPVVEWAVELALSRRAAARIWASNQSTQGAAVVPLAANAPPAARVVVVNDVPARERRATRDGRTVVAPAWYERMLATDRMCGMHAFPPNFWTEQGRLRG